MTKEQILSQMIIALGGTSPGAVAQFTDTLHAQACGIVPERESITVSWKSVTVSWQYPPVTRICGCRITRLTNGWAYKAHHNNNSPDYWI